MEKHCRNQNNKKFYTIVTLAILGKGEKGQRPAAKSFLWLRYCAVHRRWKTVGCWLYPHSRDEKVEGHEGHMPGSCALKGMYSEFQEHFDPKGIFLKLFARQSMATNPNISKCINTQNDMIRGRSLNRSQASLKITLLVRTLPLYLWTSAYLGLKKIHQIPPSPPSILKRDNWKVSRLIQRDSPTIFTQKDNCSQLNSL